MAFFAVAERKGCLEMGPVDIVVLAAVAGVRAAEAGVVENETVFVVAAAADDDDDLHSLG